MIVILVLDIDIMQDPAKTNMIINPIDEITISTYKQSIVCTSNNDNYFTEDDIEYYRKKYAHEEIICNKCKKIK